MRLLKSIYCTFFHTAHHIRYFESMFGLEMSYCRKCDTEHHRA